MAIIKCKMCGGDLVLVEGQSVAECEYCGSRQTVPVADNEKKLTLFARANRLRASCEFDKAAGIYESIVADFPEEAEAYWGLVLCKYGIEYVDDPATGKKIPTCHRSSFDSVMDDSNFEQAMENADEIALRVYREEAKQIEGIRKGILEVSSNEQPYDIFICYKETDVNGDRTTDSLLAQDIYDALTTKGYRVFFSRITLEDKLGQAYEPYIFAALNSAKIMLAVGTCYEHYNAVWVKNEWSRYLKIIAQDKNKYLIPCYKGIDAYDMPKEFAHLQGQDMGKVGAIQDLLRGVEKILPKQKPVAVVQERVVVGGSSDNKIASLLDRGNMALEDGDWAKADSFFEDVLNNDSKNAQAYLGKTLAQERCRTIDAFARKRKGLYETVKGQELALEPNTKHIEEMADQCQIPNYLTAEDIRNLYQFNLHYHSDVAERRQQYQKEESYWANHKLLSRAERFAVGPVAENLQREKKALFAALADRVKQAEAAEAAAKTDVQERYEAHLKQADARAEELYNQGLARREKHYQELLQIAKTSSSVTELTATAKKFYQLGDFQDSKNLAEHCRKRAAEEQAKLDAEAERQRLIQEKQKQARQKKTKKIATISAILAMVVIAAVFVITRIVIPSNHYNQAAALLESGRYEEAVAAFEAMDGYKDSAERIIEARSRIAYEAAEALLAAGNRSGAIAAFEALDNFADSADRILQIRTESYAMAEQLLSEGDVVHAAMAFGVAGPYSDARQRSLELWGKVVTPSTIAIDSLGTVAVKADGTAVATGNNKYHQFDLESWTDIVGVSRDYSRTIGWKADGTVVVAGRESEVSAWTDIVAISAGNNIIGLKSDGTVVVDLGNEKAEDRTGQWQDVVAVSAYNDALVGLTSDGKVLLDFPLSVVHAYDVSAWSDIVAVDVGFSHIVGLRSDGTVVATGSDNNEGQCDVSSWKDIVSVSAGNQHTVGVKKDGTVVAAGHNDYGQCEVSGWTDIVAVVAGPYYTVGVKTDGTVVAVGSDKDDKLNVDNWSGIQVRGKLADSLTQQKQESYAEAVSLLEKEQYDEALAIFQSLGNFEDAPQRVTQALYGKGEKLMEAESYAEALDIFTQLDSYQDSAQKIQEAKKGVLRTAEAGDIIYFGHCELDGDIYNGKEELPWIVVERNGNNVTLMSKYIVANMAFDMGKSNNWGSSSLKTWLNETFTDSTFSEEEMTMLQSTSAGKVYVPSLEELERWFDVSTGSYRINANIIAKTCAAKGRYGGEENWWWWTRTSDGYHNQANCVMYVSEKGIFSGNDATYTGGGVRPTITIHVGE